MSKAAFPDVTKIKFEGPQSDNPLAFQYYNADEVVEGKTMKEHLRFSTVYWHTMCGAGADMFGSPTAVRPGMMGSPAWIRRVLASQCFLSFVRSWAHPFTLFMIAMSPRTVLP